MKNKKQILWAIIFGFIVSATSMFTPYLLDSNYHNTAKWSVQTQFFVLWFFASAIIFCIDRMKVNARKLRELKNKDSQSI